MRAQPLQAENSDTDSSEAASRLLFVYGTLMRRLSLDVHSILARRGIFVCGGKLQGNLYCAGEFPAAVLSDRCDDIIVGEVYRMDDPEHLFKTLDHYEAFDANDEAGSLFVRRLVEVRLDSVNESQAWVYLYNRSIEGLQRICSGDYGEYFFGENPKLES